ncbi:MAG TPA: response regulator [Polyangiaceae bacterium]|nr:response regulator [Polyangiaceae bacterium]
MPTDGEHSEREHVRIEAVFRVQYATMDQLVVAYSSDLSKGGVFLCTRAFLPLNAVVRLMLDLPENGGEIPVICRVVYVRDDAAAASSGKRAGMGLEFLDLQEDCRGRIERFIAGQPAKSSLLPPPARRALNLLLVDDDRLSLEAAAECFRARGDVVRTAANGLDALAACLKAPPDAILSDVQMPKMDGWQLVRMVRARPTLSSIPFIFFTTLSGEEERLRAYQLGVDDFLGKPCKGEFLLMRVDRMIMRLGQKNRSPVREKTLRGDLEQVSLPSVLNFLELERKSGVLLLVGTTTARVFIADGRPLRAETEEDASGVSPRALMNQLLSWKLGQFEFAAGEVAGPDLLQCTLMGLLLEHARLSDEGARAG